MKHEMRIVNQKIQERIKKVKPQTTRVVNKQMGWQGKAISFVQGNIAFVKKLLVIAVITAIICASVVAVMIAPYVFPILFVWFVYRLVSKSSFIWTKK